MLEILAFLSVCVYVVLVKRFFPNLTAKKLIVAVVLTIASWLGGTLGKTASDYRVRAVFLTVGSLGAATSMFVLPNPALYGIRCVSAAGALSNYAVIAANGWRMPVDREAVKKYINQPSIFGKMAKSLDPVYSHKIFNTREVLHRFTDSSEDINLGLLSDNMGQWYIGTGIFSFGDCLIWLGLVISAVQLFFIRKDQRTCAAS